MAQEGLLFVTDRGGHLQNALSLLESMGVAPEFFLCTPGPDAKSLSSMTNLDATSIRIIPTLFSFVGKRRLLNPAKVIFQFIDALVCMARICPKKVVSFGATNVVFYCYFAKLFGAKVFHVDCMNQVSTRSTAGKMLYPICEELFVQWPGLEALYGPRAKYAGWVI